MRDQLDRIDLRILDVLQGNGRISNIKLSRRVNLSPSPCLARVRRLEKSGSTCRLWISRHTASIFDISDQSDYFSKMLGVPT